MSKCNYCSNKNIACETCENKNNFIPMKVRHLIILNRNMKFNIDNVLYLFPANVPEIICDKTVMSYYNSNDVLFVQTVNPDIPIILL